MTIAAILAGCASTGVMPTSAPVSKILPGTSYALSAAEAEMVKTGLKRSLKDPTSPLFGEMVATKGADGTITVCGLVNAKNSYGGYTGDQPYVGALAGTQKKAFLVVGIGGTDTDTQAVTSVCQQSGIQL